MIDDLELNEYLSRLSVLSSVR